LAGSNTITLNGTELAISDPVTITGPGASLMTIDAGGLSRHFDINDSNATSIAVSISGMSLTHGVSKASSSDTLFSSGGAILVANENLTPANMVLTGNQAGDPTDVTNSNGGFNRHGGAIEMGSGGAGSALTVTNSTIANNLATGSGGGVHFVFPNKGTGNKIT